MVQAVWSISIKTMAEQTWKANLVTCYRKSSVQSMPYISGTPGEEGFPGFPENHQNITKMQILMNSGGSPESYKKIMGPMLTTVLMISVLITTTKTEQKAKQ